MNKEKLVYSIFGILAAVLLIGGGVLHVVLKDRTYSEVEKRGLTAFSDVKSAPLADGSFMNAAENYASDQFPARELLMKLRMNALYTLGKRSSEGVYYGQDGRMIEAFEPYDEALLKENAAALNAFYQEAGAERFYFMPVPTAVEMYPELLPASAETASESAWIEEFTKELEDGIEVLDVRPLFRVLKNAGHELYYYTDHHWTTEAARSAFLYFASDLGWKAGTYESGVVTDQFFGSLASKSGFTPTRYDSLTVYRNLDPDLVTLVAHPSTGVSGGSFYDLSKLETSNPYEVYLGGNEPIITVTTTADTERTLLVVKDSYANCFVPFLAGSYKRITIVDPRYYTGSLSALLTSAKSTDVLVLYNVSTLSTDRDLKTMVEIE